MPPAATALLVPFTLGGPWLSVLLRTRLSLRLLFRTRLSLRLLFRTRLMLGARLLRPLRPLLVGSTATLAALVAAGLAITPTLEPPLLLAVAVLVARWTAITPAVASLAPLPVGPLVATRLLVAPSIALVALLARLWRGLRHRLCG